jgi:hypothetical protein
MALSDYTPESREVALGQGKSFHVSGLSLQHIEILVRTHLPDLEELLDVFMSEGGNFEGEDLKKLGITLASRAPGFVANVIALGAGETDATATAAKLPFPIQLQALADVFEITFTEVGGIKKFMETVAALLGQMNLKIPKKLSEGMTPTNLG